MRRKEDLPLPASHRRPSAVGALRSLLAVALLMGMGLVFPASSQTSDPRRPPAERRVALVVGVGGYRAVPALPNPPNDAADISAALNRLGFEVETLIDADRGTIEAAIRRLGRRAAGADAALFYFAGHALEAGGRNWLLPATAEPQRDRDLRFEALDLDAVIEQLDGQARLSIVILDACRDNPFRQRFAGTMRAFDSGGAGLAQIRAAVGTLVAFATAPGTVAEDGARGQRNSPFTAAILRHIERPGLEVRQLFAEVRRDVREATRGRQVPWEHSALEGSFHFRPAEPPRTTTSERRTVVGSDAELLFWESVRQSRNPAAIVAYVNRFPDGLFVDLARLRIAELEAEASTQPAATAAPPVVAPAVQPAPAQQASVVPAVPPRQDPPPARPAQPGTTSPTAVVAATTASPRDASLPNRPPSPFAPSRHELPAAGIAPESAPDLSNAPPGAPAGPLVVPVPASPQTAAAATSANVAGAASGGRFAPSGVGTLPIPDGVSSPAAASAVASPSPSPPEPASAASPTMVQSGAPAEAATRQPVPSPTSTYVVPQPSPANTPSATPGAARDRAAPAPSPPVTTGPPTPTEGPQVIAALPQPRLPLPRAAGPDQEPRSDPPALPSLTQALAGLPRERAEAAIRAYSSERPSRALAVAPRQRIAVVAGGAGTGEQAEEVALERCQLRAGEPCIPVATNDQVRGLQTLARAMPRVRYGGTFEVTRIPALLPAMRSAPIFGEYAESSAPRAIALHASGRFAVVLDAVDQRASEEEALRRCNVVSGRDGLCLLYAVAERVVLAQRKTAALTPPTRATEPEPPTVAAVVARPTPPPLPAPDSGGSRYPRETGLSARNASFPFVDSARAEQIRQSFLAGGLHRALAFRPGTTNWGSSTGSASIADARYWALLRCRRSGTGPCVMYIEDDRVVFDPSASQASSATESAGSRPETSAFAGAGQTPIPSVVPNEAHLPQGRPQSRRYEGRYEGIGRMQQAIGSSFLISGGCGLVGPGSVTATLVVRGDRAELRTGSSASPRLSGPVGDDGSLNQLTARPWNGEDHITGRVTEGAFELTWTAHQGAAMRVCSFRGERVR